MQAYSTGLGPGAVPHVPLRKALPIFLLAVFLGQHVAAQSGELYGTEHPYCHSSTLAAAEAAAHIAAAAAAAAAHNCTQSSSNNYHGGETTGTATTAAAAAAAAAAHNCTQSSSNNYHGGETTGTATTAAAAAAAAYSEELPIVAHLSYGSSRFLTQTTSGTLHLHAVGIAWSQILH